MFGCACTYSQARAHTQTFITEAQEQLVYCTQEQEQRSVLYLTDI